MSEKKLRIKFIAGDISGPAYHDIFIPTKYFDKYQLLEVDLEPTINDQNVKDLDIVILQRQYHPDSFYLVKQLKTKGVTTIFICDDDVWALPKVNPAYSTYKGMTLDRYQMILQACDQVTTSTEWLRKRCLPFNPEVYVQRNLVEPEITDFLTPGRDNPEEVRILWTTTPHHAADIPLVGPALRTICKKYKNVKIIFFGWHPPNTYNWIPKEQYEYYNFVPVDAFYNSMANLDGDIGIIPLEDNDFNRGKTCRKFQEYSILKIPSVVSPVGNYPDIPDDVIVKAWKNQFTSWIDQLSILIENPDKRQALGQKAYEYVLENHDINKHIFARAENYKSVWRRVNGKEA
jgi:glycosyltransferase involved in cell wall biosynthesis